MTVSGTVSQHSETEGNAHFSSGSNREVVNAQTGTPADLLCWILILAVTVLEAARMHIW